MICHAQIDRAAGVGGARTRAIARADAAVLHRRVAHRVAALCVGTVAGGRRAVIEAARRDDDDRQGGQVLLPSAHELGLAVLPLHSLPPPQHAIVHDEVLSEIVVPSQMSLTRQLMVQPTLSQSKFAPLHVFVAAQSIWQLVAEPHLTLLPEHVP